MDILRAIDGQLVRTSSGELAICGPSDPCSVWTNPPANNPTAMLSVNGIFFGYSECPEISAEQYACMWALAGAFGGFVPNWPGDGMCTWLWSSSTGVGDGTLAIIYAPPSWYAAFEITYSYGVTGYGWLNYPMPLPDGAMNIVDGKLSGAFTLSGLCSRGNVYCIKYYSDPVSYPMSNHVSSVLLHPPIYRTTVDIRASATDGGDPPSWYEFHMHDDGSGHLVAPEITGGVIDYDTGTYEFTLSNGGDFVLDLEPVWYYHTELFSQFPFSLAVTVNQA